MSIEILIDKTGAMVNNEPNLIQLFPGSSASGSQTMFKKQIVLEFFDEVIVGADGVSRPNYESVVTTGVTGTLTVSAKPSKYAAYNVALPGNGILNLANTNILQWEGIVQTLEFVGTTVTGTEYINVVYYEGV